MVLNESAAHAVDAGLHVGWFAAAATAARVLDLSADVVGERTAGRTRVVLARLEGFRGVPEVKEVLQRAS
ncbi:hypothetical protein ACFOSC_13660 [Streptantibioticus rubrisoli]|uniref:Uncharacterized protein n=1 Tax=Streptantibioticus rubrisoli TaxID=1387313 RepID=A0ABT1PCE9_9ACTN|nr:hypothetical protein [Streptantibioticus rubrisoli]MCQ4043029.1 hypothetical protein [Streptantibioticus rubrisoli]